MFTSRDKFSQVDRSRAHFGCRQLRLTGLEFFFLFLVFLFPLLVHDRHRCLGSFGSLRFPHGEQAATLPDKSLLERDQGQT